MIGGEAQRLSPWRRSQPEKKKHRMHLYLERNHPSVHRPSHVEQAQLIHLCIWRIFISAIVTFPLLTTAMYRGNRSISYCVLKLRALRKLPSQILHGQKERMKSSSEANQIPFPAAVGMRMILPYGCQHQARSACGRVT